MYDKYITIIFNYKIKFRSKKITFIHKKKRNDKNNVALFKYVIS